MTRTDPLLTKHASDVALRRSDSAEPGHARSSAGGPWLCYSPQYIALPLRLAYCACTGLGVLN
jgi:hypothetical protein